MVEETEEKKRGFRATFSMGDRLYDQLSVMRWDMNQFAGLVLIKDSQGILNLYAALVVYYSNVRFIVKDYPRFDKDLDSIKELLKEYNQRLNVQKNLFPDTLADALIKFFRDIITVSQMAGLGIDVKRDISINKIKRDHLEGK